MSILSSVTTFITTAHGSTTSFKRKRPLLIMTTKKWLLLTWILLAVLVLYSQLHSRTDAFSVMADVNLLLLWNDDGGDEGDVDNVDTSLQNSRDAAGVSPVETSGNGMNETTSEREREEGDKESSSLSDKTMHPQKDKQEVETGLTVLITSYKQPTCLNRLIRHYQTCDIVHSININHFHDNHTLPPIYAYAKKHNETCGIYQGTQFPQLSILSSTHFDHCHFAHGRGLDVFL